MCVRAQRIETEKPYSIHLHFRSLHSPFPNLNHSHRPPFLLLLPLISFLYSQMGKAGLGVGERG